ncbi:MAG: type III-B CRISPR module RAMP protein Cmr6, partial [Methanoregula sp.]|nr:type III-B CRISPR module RAMP protein Cmr6 [Methanoregula sp.]
AWIVPEAAADSLQLDIMTPHHPEYYKGSCAPTDFDDPIPLPFVSISGTFCVAVSCDVPGSNGKKWQVLAFQLITEALGSWGIGGKTSAGYGRMVKQGGGIPKKKTGFTSRLSVAGKPYPSGEMKSDFKKSPNNPGPANKHGQQSGNSGKSR